jgi:mono/diheme cytochrome c family protein
MNARALLLLLCMLHTGCAAPTPVGPPPTPTVSPAALAAGERAYAATCMACHGPRAMGTTQGPALVHKIYEPSHHADAAFLLAVRQGVRAHHWQFGDMPAQPNVSDAELRAIVVYVRALQREAGIQ